MPAGNQSLGLFMPSSRSRPSSVTLNSGSGIGVSNESRQLTAPALSALIRMIISWSVNEANTSSVNLTPPAVYSADATALPMSSRLE